MLAITDVREIKH